MSLSDGAREFARRVLAHPPLLSGQQLTVSLPSLLENLLTRIHWPNRATILQINECLRGSRDRPCRALHQTKAGRNSRKKPPNVR